MPLPSTLSPAEAAAIREFVAEARRILGSDYREARLFGSRARGDAHEESDVDIALIVGPAGRAQRDALYDLAFDIGLVHRVHLAPLVIDERRLAELKARELRIAAEIESQGIPV